MKKSLTLLSSVAFFTLTGNTISTVNSVGNTNLKQQTSSNSEKELFNNKYNYLNAGNWITNQSKSDYNFYSYDTSYANFKLSNGANARTVFSVDNNGQLQFDRKLIPVADLNNIKNIAEEMNSHKEVTNIKSRYNAYSKSLYSSSYFSGGGSNWQYIQEGGAQKNIDISSQQSANKVEHSNNLSEPLGIYYIAKAVRTTGGIDEKVGIDLAKYFIAQSSLRGNINDNLVTKMLDLIATNNDIYNFIYQTPLTVTDKNYSINYIFDNSNNLIEIYYNKWTNTDNSINNINLNMSHTGSDWNYGYQGWYSNIGTLVNWKQYTNSWDDFIAMYPNFNFGSDSYLQVYNNQTGNNKITNLKDNTANISSNKPADLSNIANAIDDWNSHAYSRFSVQKQYDNGYNWSEVNLALYIWHDDNNICYQVACFMACHDVQNEGNSYNLHLDNCTFNNIMK